MPTHTNGTPPTRGSPVLLVAGYWACVAIAVVVVVRRVAVFANRTPTRVPQLSALDQAFAGHAVLTLAHILPALLFVVLTPFVLFGRRGMRAAAEPWLFGIGYVVGATAYAMSVYAVGGWLERSAVLVFNTLFLISLTVAFLERRDPGRRRRWLVRAIVVLLGIATTRPVMGTFFATSRITHLAPQQFFGIAFWIGFSINLIVVEMWLRSGRRKSSASHLNGTSLLPRM